jgi:hypothetical protein
MKSTPRSEASSRKNAALTSIRKLRVASLLVVVALVIGATPLLVVLGSLFTFNVDVVASAVFSWIILVVVALVLGLVAIYAYLIPSAQGLAELKPEEFQTVSSLLVVGYVGGLLTTLLAVVLLALDFTGVTGRSPLVALLVVVLLVAGAVLLTVGWIGNIAYFLKLRDVFNSSAFLVAGVLLIIPLLSIISWILTYVEASSIERKILTGQIKL